MHNRSDNCWFSAGSLVCLWLAAITVLLTLFSVDAYAQAIYGSLNGTVTDSGGRLSSTQLLLSQTWAREPRTLLRPTPTGTT